MTMAEDLTVSLREFLDEQWNSHQQQHTAEAKTFELRFAEMGRRIDLLNQDLANTRVGLGQTVPNEAYQNARADLESRVRVIETFQSNLTGRLMVIGGVVAIILTILGGVLVAYITKQ